MVSYEQTHRQCRRCGKPTIHYRKATNHLLHLFLTILLCGWWAIVWLLLAFKIGGWRCQECGAGARLPKMIGGAVAIVGMAVTGLMILGMMQSPPSSSSTPSRPSPPTSPVEMVGQQDPPADSAGPTVEPAMSDPPLEPKPVDTAPEPTPKPETPAPAEVVPSPEMTAPSDASAVVSSRTWTDASGQFTIEAEFAGYAVGNVRLKKADGSTLVLPIEKLSQADQEWIRNRGR